MFRPHGEDAEPRFPCRSNCTRPDRVLSNSLCLVYRSNSMLRGVVTARCEIHLPI